MFDLIIKNALMVDGTGSLPTNKDIGITKDKFPNRILFGLLTKLEAVILSKIIEYAP